jgi:hypothetical protein
MLTTRPNDSATTNQDPRRAQLLDLLEKINNRESYALQQIVENPMISNDILCDAIDYAHRAKIQDKYLIILQVLLNHRVKISEEAREKDTQNLLKYTMRTLSLTAMLEASTDGMYEIAKKLLPHKKNDCDGIISVAIEDALWRAKETSNLLRKSYHLSAESEANFARYDHAWRSYIKQAPKAHTVLTSTVLTHTATMKMELNVIATTFYAEIASQLSEYKNISQNAEINRIAIVALNRAQKIFEYLALSSPNDFHFYQEQLAGCNALLATMQALPKNQAAIDDSKNIHSTAANKITLSTNQATHASNPMAAQQSFSANMGTPSLTLFSPPWLHAQLKRQTSISKAQHPENNLPIAPPSSALFQPPAQPAAQPTKLTRATSLDSSGIALTR